MIDPIVAYTYIHKASNLLRGFKEVREGVYNFACPFCGDSHNTNKKRGYLLKKDNDWVFYCHNCGTSYNLNGFLQNIDSDLHKEFILSRFKNNKKFDFSKDEREVFKNIKQFVLPDKNTLKSIVKLDKTHPAVEYVLNRKIPIQNIRYIKWTDDFPKLVKDTIGEKYDNVKLPKSGIIFELRNMSGEVTGYQIRSIDKDVPKSQRFVICSKIEKHDYFYTNLDTTKTHYIIEGCSDVLCVPNSCAVLSASLHKAHFNDKSVYVNDNEPRNEAVVKHIYTCINKGYKTVLLPDTYEGMDMNDLIKNGVKYSEINELLDKYTFSGIRAKIEFAKWKKI